MDNDKWLTPKHAVIDILKYIPKGSTILCPFDTKDSEFVKVLSKEGHNVYYSHIDGYMGCITKRYSDLDKYKLVGLHHNFFDYTLKDFEMLGIQYIISNPPYSQRKQVINTLFQYNLPFMMLMPLVSIALKDFRTKINNLEILAFLTRIKFKNPENLKLTNAPSETGYICRGVLPKQMMINKDIDC